MERLVFSSMDHFKGRINRRLVHTTSDENLLRLDEVVGIFKLFYALVVHRIEDVIRENGTYKELPRRVINLLTQLMGAHLMENCFSKLRRSFIQSLLPTQRLTSIFMRFNQYLTRTDLITQDFVQIIESEYKWPLHNFIEKWAEFCARVNEHAKQELTESSYQTATGGLHLMADRNQDEVSLTSIKLLVQILHKRMHRLKLCHLSQLYLDAEDIHDSSEVVQRAKNQGVDKWPLIVKFGNGATPYFIMIEGNMIAVDGTFACAVQLLLESVYTFSLDYPPDLKNNVFFFLEQLYGLQHVKGSTASRQTWEKLFS